MHSNKKEYNSEKINFLRKNAKLDIISLIKLEMYKEELEKLRMWYYNLEGELLDGNFQEIKNYEYLLRLKIWERKCIPLWNQVKKESKMDIDLFEFAQAVMEENINTKKKIKKH